MYVLDVAIDVPLTTVFSYTHTDKLAIGTRVNVNFTSRNVVAIVINCYPVGEYAGKFPLSKLKAINAAHDASTAVPENTIKLCKFASQYYHHSLGETLSCALPKLLRITKSLPTIDFDNLAKYYKPAIKTPKNDTLHSLTSEQEQVIQDLQQKFTSFNATLLFGITGSGKTEVYLNLIDKVLQNNQQVLVLIPEINLTPQLINTFSSRFLDKKICTIHSGVSDKQRLVNWLLAKNGIADIVIGTRSAIFTPFNNLGMIIVDEEHDSSFKQNDTLRYNARDLAVYLAKQQNISIVLGSATPSLETLYNLKQGKYSLTKLTTRANVHATLPQMQLINLNHDKANYAGISSPAIEALNTCLEQNEIALVYINRRGYAPIISCYECGWISHCPYCTSKMVYHQQNQMTKCHHCGYQTKVPTACPTCNNQYLHTIGHGTQKVEEFLQLTYPDKKILRIDRDTTTTKKAWDEIYSQINEGKVDILLGTQMLAKGHNFKNLTLVIGLNIDNGLYNPDFRASEETFANLMQVSGRAGRAEKKGIVLLQTNYPDHPLYQFILRHDFNGFVNYTMQERYQLKLPPFSFYAILRFSTLSERKFIETTGQLNKLREQITHDTAVHIFHPVPAIVSKLNNKYRGQMLIRSTDRKSLHSYLDKINVEVAKLNIQYAIDVDPMEA